MSSDQRAWDDCNRDLLGRVGRGVCSRDVLPHAAEAADGGICIAENVSGMRVDHAAGEGGVPGVREGAGQRSGGAAGPGVNLGVRNRNFRVGAGLIP